MNILFVGLSGLPRRTRACDVRLTFFANLLAKNNQVLILNRYSSLELLNMVNTNLNSKVRVFEIINPKNTGKMLSKLYLMLSLFIEPFRICQLNKKYKIDVLHVYSGHYIDFIIYKLIRNIINCKVVYQYVEYRTAFPPRGLYHKLNNYLCDYYGMKLFDGVLPISHYLENKAKDVNPNILSLKIPPICDFELFNSNKLHIPQNNPYLLFCASVEYLNVIEFVVESYSNSLISKDKSLVLVLSGSKFKIEKLKERWTNCIIISQLSYDELISYYKNAYALFIPLRPIVSDIARFPNKICEYLASQGVIITTNVGEISYYFKDKENAIVANEYSVENMVECLDSLYREEYDYESLKNNAYTLGEKVFNYDVYERSLQLFLEKLRQMNC